MLLAKTEQLFTHIIRFIQSNGFCFVSCFFFFFFGEKEVMKALVLFQGFEESEVFNSSGAAFDD